MQTSARLGASTDGGDVEQRYGLVSGARWSSGGIVASAEISRATAIYGRQRTYAATRSPTLTLMPSVKSENLVVSANQTLTGNLSLDVDTLFNRRRSMTSFASNVAGNINQSGMRTSYANQSFAIAPTLRWSPGGDWRLSVSGSYGRDRTHYTITNFRAGTATDSPRNCYCNGALAGEIGGDGSLGDLPAGALKIALGAGYRLNRFSRYAGPGNAHNVQHNQASSYAYGELNIPLIAPEQNSQLIYRLTASAAVRFERYPHIGEVVTPKLGLIFAPSSDLDLKGSWGRSFRAPTLLQQYQARSIVLIAPSIFGGTGYPAGSVAFFVQGGNPALKPERATTWSTTVDFHPTVLPGARFEISYFSVDYRDRIVTPITFVTQSLSNPIYRDRITGAPSPAVLAALLAGTNDIGNFTGAPYDPAKVAVLIDDSNINAGRQTAKGVDLLASYRLCFDGGVRTLTATLDTSYLTSTQQISSTQPVLPLAGLLFNPPHWRARGGLDWDAGWWGMTAMANYAGSISDVRFVPVAKLKSITSIDLAAHVSSGERGPIGHVEISLSVQNLFNAKPDPIRTSLFSDTPYDSTNYSPVGRFVAARIVKKW
ncbi:MAG: TonB-dependent receptor [Sphingomonadaceae bacterium]|nr:TonB-dependent receptor [Sphingomonadaceae bacterium]